MNGQIRVIYNYVITSYVKEIDVVDFINFMIFYNQNCHFLHHDSSTTAN